MGEDRREVAQVQTEVEEARAELDASLPPMAVAAEDKLEELERQAKANLAKLQEKEQTRREQERARLAEIERKRREGSGSQSAGGSRP